MKRLSQLALLIIILVANTSFFGATYSKTAFYVVIDKSEYELKVYDAEGWLITYPVVFGSNDLSDKLVQGDRRTPEGSFTIVNKRVHNKWCRFFGLDYPTKQSVEVFNTRKQTGIIPAQSKIGGDIGIHGTWPHEDYAIDQYQNWTQGCISLKNEHVTQLYNLLPVGTRVTIIP